MWVDKLYPQAFYADILANMRLRKRGGEHEERRQDSAQFVNSRYNLVGCPDPVIETVHRIWSDPEVMATAYARFYSSDADELAAANEIHTEFEFTFCAPGRFQNIHVDIPSKTLSFVFYIPDSELNEEQERRNATILYDRDMKPRYAARYRENSVCIFAPHFHSYHGFHSTVERDALVMFYIDHDLHANFRALNKTVRPQGEGLLQAIEEKLRNYTLREYGNDAERIALERTQTKINAPLGRVLLEGQEGKRLDRSTVADDSASKEPKQVSDPLQ